MMLYPIKITEIFCLSTIFCIELDQVLDKNGIDDGSAKEKGAIGACKMSQARWITIMVAFTISKGYRCL